VLLCVRYTGHSRLRQDVVQQLFEAKGALGERPARRRLVDTGAEQLVGDVEGHEDGQSQAIGTGCRLDRGPHLGVHVRGELGDVGGVERAPNGVMLAADFNGNDAGRIHRELDRHAFEVRQHLGDARANHVALFAEAGELDIRRLGVSEPFS
jgi:hypothetical protein